MKLDKLLETVDGPESFLEFVRKLREDKMSEANHPVDEFGRGASGWENHTIEDFLEAAIAWADDSSFGIEQGLRDGLSWKLFATFLYCGKIYE
jgi:hypothetical protein